MTMRCRGMQTRANRGYNRRDINQTLGDKRMATRCPYCQTKAYIRTTDEIDAILSEAFKPYIGIDLPLVAPPQLEAGQLCLSI